MESLRDAHRNTYLLDSSLRRLADSMNNGPNEDGGHIQLTTAVVEGSLHRANMALYD